MALADDTAAASALALPFEWLPASGAPEQLILLWHGWRSDARAMAPLAEALRSAFPQAAVLVPNSPLGFRREAAGAARGGAAAPEASHRAPDLAAAMAAAAAGRSAEGDAGAGRMWYSIAGLADDPTGTEWPRRVHACLPALTAWVRAQQRRLNVSAAATALGGFSQGAILAMAAVQEHDGLAGRVLAFGGSYTRPPTAAPQRTTLHLFHGSADAVIPAERSRQALRWLGELQGDATLDIAEGIGHELHPSLIECALHRLTHHIPLRTWREALGAAPAPAESAGPREPQASDTPVARR